MGIRISSECRDEFELCDAFKLYWVFFSADGVLEVLTCPQVAKVMLGTFFVDDTGSDVVIADMGCGKSRVTFGCFGIIPILVDSDEGVDDVRCWVQTLPVRLLLDDRKYAADDYSINFGGIHHIDLFGCNVANSS